MNQTWKLTTICPVFMCDDVKRTTDFYVRVLGFQYASHFDTPENFAAVYRDQIELILVQKRKGEVKSNVGRYGAGEDAYITPSTLEAVRAFHDELKEKGVPNLTEPAVAEYGSLEFTFEDIDGRTIGVGLIADRERFFRTSDHA